jgi:ABC-type transport system involved in multi-copper enzyme maturation permease subunit
MGVTPIEYRPWDGKRTDYWRRFLVISNNVFRQKLKSKMVLVFLIIGVILAHVFPIIFYTLLPHEKLTPEMMVGEEPTPVDVDIDGEVEVVGDYLINGSFRLDGAIELRGETLGGGIYGNGTISGMDLRLTDTIYTGDGWIVVVGTFVLDGLLNISGGILGDGFIFGNCTVTGDGALSRDVVEGERQEDQGMIREREGGNLKNGFLIIFTILLASLVCSDLVASDLGDNSFILFFSRPIKTYDYLAGKIVGALWILGLFCFLPLLIFCIAVMGTQSGSDYGTSLKVLGSTILAGLLTAFIFVPYGIFISSMTKRKTYATIGIFMSFFVLIIIGEIFSYFDKNWVLIDPTRVLFYSYDILYGFSIPEGINSALLGVILFSFMVIPLVLVYLRVHLKGVGK